MEMLAPVNAASMGVTPEKTANSILGVGILTKGRMPATRKGNQTEDAEARVSLEEAHSTVEVKAIKAEDVATTVGAVTTVDAYNLQMHPRLRATTTKDIRKARAVEATNHQVPLQV